MPLSSEIDSTKDPYYQLSMFALLVESFLTLRDSQERMVLYG